MTEKTTVITEGLDAEERAEARVDENAAIVEQQTEAQVALIGANAEADAERIAAQAAADVERIEAQKGAEEWREILSNQQTQISALTTQITDLASQLALILLLPSIAEALNNSTPPSTEPKQTEPPLETPMEVIEENVVLEKPEPLRKVVRRRLL